jgi:hypothetical protein
MVLLSVFLKPQNSIFHRLAATGPKSKSKAKIVNGFAICFLKTSEEHFPLARYIGAEEQKQS